MYAPEHDIIAICCTGGTDKRKLTYQVLKQGIPILKYVLSIAHPSTWSRNCSNRKIEILLDGHTDRMSEDEFFCEKDYSKLYKRLFGK